MIVFIDTSAFYALLDRNDENHPGAAAAWRELLSGEDTLLTNNYVVVETSALVQNRLGPAALRAFYEGYYPLLTVDWVSERRHLTGVEAVLTAARRKLSLVDCVSFQTMRESAARTAFCFDPHFREQGFHNIP